MPIENKSDLKEWLLSEKRNYKIKSPFALYLFAGNEQAVIWQFQRRLRITEFYKNTGNKLRYKSSLFILNHKRNRYGLHIGLNVCGKGLKILHLGPILTHKDVIIGENASLHINTAFVAHGVNNKVPIVGNNVVIGVGAVLLGDIKIADNIAVGANALVNKSFLEEGIAIAGVPAKKVSDNGKAKWS